MDYKDKKEDIINELEELNSNYLADWKNIQEPNSLPDGYLNSVYDRVLEPKDKPLIRIIRNPQSWAIAASLFIVACSFYLLRPTQTSELVGLDDQDIIAYLLESEHLSTEDLTEITGVTEQLSYDMDIDDEDIIYYLDNDIENIDLIELNTY